MKFKKIAIVFFSIVAFVAFSSLSFAGHMGSKSGMKSGHGSKGKMNRGSTNGSGGGMGFQTMKGKNVGTSQESDSTNTNSHMGTNSNMGSGSNMHGDNATGTGSHHNSSDQNMMSGSEMGGSDSHMTTTGGTYGHQSGDMMGSGQEGT